MSEHAIDTLHGDEYATMLIKARIPFRVSYHYEFQATFSVDPEHRQEAGDLMMKLRASKL